MGQYSVGGRQTRYTLEVPGINPRVLTPSLPIHTGPGAYAVFYTMVIRSLSRVKTAGA